MKELRSTEVYIVEYHAGGGGTSRKRLCDYAPHFLQLETENGEPVVMVSANTPNSTAAYLRWVIDIARAGDAATLASATDAADQLLHRDELAAQYGPEVAACADALRKLAEKQDTDAALRWAGAGAEASDPEALAQMREAER